MIDNCTTCNGLGFVYDIQQDRGWVHSRIRADACPACAVAAEIEYIEWKRHGSAQLTLDLETDTGADLPENVLDLRKARSGRQ